MPSRLAAKWSLINSLKEAIVTCCFLGRVPKIPGTMGTLGGFLIALVLPWDKTFPIWAGGIALVLLGIGWSLGSWAEGHFGRKDPQPFVLDETVGYLLTVCAMSPRWTGLVLGFFLFRFFDVWKPYPAKSFERFPAAAGIFLDDLVAAAYACIVLVVIRSLLPEL